jgi:hypothetical protein
VKKFLVACVVAVAFFAAPADAQTAPKNQRYCVLVASGPVDCRFETMEQCRASYSQGLGGGRCILNPTLDQTPDNKKSN